MRSCSPTSTWAACRSPSERVSTPFTGARACCSVAPFTAFPTRRTRSTYGKASHSWRFGEGTVPAARRILVQAQPASELALAGQWFYNWQAVRILRSRAAISTINDELSVRGRFDPSQVRIRWPVSFRVRRRCSGSGMGTDSGTHATAAASATSAFRRAGAPSGSTERSASTAASPRHRAAALRDARRRLAPRSAVFCTAIGGTPSRPGRPPINPAATNPRRSRAEGQGRAPTAMPTATTSTSTGVSLSKNIAGVSLGCGVLVPAEHAAVRDRR